MIKNIKRLSKILKLDQEVLEDQSAFSKFPLQVPKSFVSRIKAGDINDPLFLQIFPRKQELQEFSDFVTDPLLEEKHSPIPGVIHKYSDRLLLLVSRTCAINCRFCFRRYSNNQVLDWEQVFRYIEKHPNVHEIILSGGDPLMIAGNKLAKIIKQLAKMPQIKRLRMHSRVPIVIPKKVIDLKLPKTRLPIVLVVHCNHPNEINKEVSDAIKFLHKAGIVIFNQSVLLRDINDHADILISLSEKLFELGVYPYYVHLVDKVKGSWHFYVERNKAKRLRSEMQRRLPGYLVPKFIVEIKNKKIYV